MQGMPTKVRWIAVTFLVIAGAGYWYLNSGYEGLSPSGYKLAMALYSACNQRDNAKLEKLSELIQDAQKSGDLPNRDSRWLQKVVHLGQNQDWESASSMVRRIMMDQAESVPLPTINK